MEGRGMKDMNSRIVGIEISRHELIDSRFGWYFSSKIRVCDGRMCAEKKCRSISRGTWFRLLDFFVILFEFFLVVGEVVLDFGDLKSRVSNRTIRLKYVPLWQKYEGQFD
jgi:hypothetical protein